MIIIIQAVVLDFHRYEWDESGPLLFIGGAIQFCIEDRSKSHSAFEEKSEVFGEALDLGA